MTTDASPLCTGCVRDLPWILGRVSRAPRFCAGVYAAFSYREPINHLIIQGKYHGDVGACGILGGLLAQILVDASERPELFAPIPMPWPRVLWRGFNHSVSIADAMSRELGIQTAPRCLLRRGWQRPQKALTRQQRLSNLNGAFRLGRSVRDLHIGLVDDVLTTGATMESAAKVLHDGGARRIDVFVVAIRD